MSRVVISGASRHGTCAFTSHGGWLGVGGVAKAEPTRSHVVHGWGLTNRVSRKWANGWSLLCDVTSCYSLWPMAARQQCSASGGRRQLMQGVFTASLVFFVALSSCISATTQNSASLRLSRHHLYVSGERLFRFGRPKCILIPKPCILAFSHNYWLPHMLPMTVSHYKLCVDLIYSSLPFTNW